MTFWLALRLTASQKEQCLNNFFKLYQRQTQTPFFNPSVRQIFLPRCGHLPPLGCTALCCSTFFPHNTRVRTHGQTPSLPPSFFLCGSSALSSSHHREPHPDHTGEAVMIHLTRQITTGATTDVVSSSRLDWQQHGSATVAVCVSRRVLLWRGRRITEEHRLAVSSVIAVVFAFPVHSNGQITEMRVN